MENTDNLAYSDAIEEIERILGQIEGKDLDIDELSGNVNRALALIRVCKGKLRKTEDELERALNETGEAPAEPSAQE
jgi:exodeoxyribonuclease VII small subunit